MSSMQFWPTDISDAGTDPPHMVLWEAAKELTEATGGQLMAEVVHRKLSDRMQLTLVATASNALTATLFEVATRLSAPYPAAITPPDADLPQFLKRDRYVPSFADGLVGTAISGHTVRNQWICGNPREFRAKISDLCKSDAVRAMVINLLALSSPSRAATEVPLDPPAGGNADPESEEAAGSE